MNKIIPAALALFCLNTAPSTAQTTYINEDFSTAYGTNPPMGWTPFIMPFTSNPAVDSFHFDNPGLRILNTPITDPACIFDSDFLSNDGTAEQVMMITPSFNTSAATMVMLEFDQYLDASFGGQVFVVVSDGTLADTVFNSAVSSPDPDHQVIDISAVGAGKATVNVAFIWTGDWAMFWMFDNVNVYTPAANDLGVIGIDAPVSGCGLIATEDVAVRVKNFGSAAQTLYTVSYTINGGIPVTESPLVSIAPGDTLSYTFITKADLSTPGIYVFDAYTFLLGDADNTNDSTVNDSVVNGVTVSVFPMVEDFESEVICGEALFACNPDGACPLSGNWMNGTGDDIDWSVDEGGTGSAGTGPSVDHTTGTATGKYLFTEASSCNGQIASLISQCLDITVLSAPTLSYWYHMAGANMGNLYALVDTGSWFIVDSLIGAQQSVESAPWLKHTIDLTPYSGIIRIAFLGITGAGFASDIALDDISIFQPPAIDAGVVGISAPVSGCGLSAADAITIQVVNFGSSTIDTIPVAYTIDGGSPVTDTIFASLLAGDTAIFTFSATGDFSAIATYAIDAWTQFTGDADNSNDSVIGYSVTHTATIASFPYTEGFESGNGSWASSGTNATWALGTPASTFIPAAANGINAWVTNLTGTYNNLEVSYLISPCIDFTALTADPALNFSHIFTTESCCDQGWVEYSMDAGASWSKLGTAGTGTNWYNDTGNDWWDGNSGATGIWRTATHTLTGLAGQDSVRIRFVFTSDLSVTDEGFGVDDINIFELTSDDVGAWAVNSPVSGCGLSAAESITIQVINYGAATQTVIPVSYEVNGGGPVNETISTTLLSGDTLTYSFATTADLSTPGTYNINAWTSLPGDINTANDSALGYSIINSASVSVFPYTEDFELGTLGGFTTGNVIGTLNWVNTAIRGGDAGHTNTQSAYFGNPADTTFATGVTEGAELTLSCIDFSLLTGIRMSFNYFLETEQTVGFDVAEVLISTDGVTFTTLADNQGIGNLTDGSGVWQNMILNLDAYAGNPTVLIRFSFNSGDTIANTFEGFYVDDINIFIPPAADLGVISIDAPNSACDLGAAETVSITVENFGSATQDTIPVAYSLNGGPAVIDTIFSSIAPGATDTFTFAVTADLSSSGVYTFDAWTSVVGDGDNTNDSTIGTLVTHNAPITVFPVFEDFESEALCGNALFTCNPDGACPLVGYWANDAGDDIDWSTTTGGTPSGPATGPSADHTTGTGQYMFTESSGGCNAMTGYLTSACLDVSALSAPALSYWYHMNGIDMGNLYVDVYDAGAWTAVDSITGPQQVADTDPWLMDSVDLSAFSGIIQLRFRGTTGLNFASDIAIDDITVYDNVSPGADVGIVAVTAPSSHCDDGAADPVSVQVVNLGTVAQDTIPVAYSVNGGPVILDTVTGALLPGDTVLFTFSTGAVLSPAGVFTLDAWTDLTGDINNANDSAVAGVVIFTNPVISLGADTTICSGASVTLNTANFGYSGYLWSTGDTDSTITTSLAGAYSLTVTDGNGCTGLDTIIVSTNPALVLTTGKTDATCGASDGSAYVTATDGTSPFTYLWDDPGAQTNDTAVALAAASYSVIVSDALGCSANAIVAVNNAGAPTVAATEVQGISCAGGSNAIAAVTVTGGTAPFSYLWNDPGAQTADTATGLTASTYTVTVTDSAGCIATDFVTIAEPPALVLSPSSVNSNCGQSDGSASVGVSGGTGVYTYLWDDPASQTTATAANLPANPYQVIVWDANACADSAAAVVTDVAGGTVSISASNSASCNGTCDGDATASVSGGTSPFTYLWDDPAVQTTASASGLCAGSYLVSVTDINGCTDTISVTITEPAALVLVMNAVDAACGAPDGSASTSVSGGAGPYTYLWNDPGAQTNDTATGLGAGAYIVIVTDAAGCQNSDVANVNNIGGPAVNISSSTNILCNGDATGSATASASGGTPPYTYLWSDPGAQSDSAASGLSAGLYTVTVTDNNSCAATDFVSLSEPLTISSTVSATAESCPGACNGTASVVAGGGAGGFTYLWNDPAAQTTSTASGLCATTHTIQITDGNGCNVYDSVAVSSGSGFTVTTTTNDASCGNADGSASAATSGGTAPFTFIWDDPSSQTTASALGLAAGTYNVLVTDANGCTGSQTAAVGNVGAPVVSIVSSNDVLCNGGNSGGATAGGTGGTGTYSYLWNDSGSQTTATAAGLAAGTYNVSITDSLGCIGAASVTIGEPAVLAASSAKSDPVCNGSCDGSAAVSVSGGTAPYTFLWDDPSAQTDSMPSGLCAGTVTVVVTDNNGCISGASETLADPAAIALTISTTDASCGFSNGTATVTATSGNAPYTYLWDDISGQTDSSASGLASGTYNVTVTDAAGCTSTGSAVVGSSGGPSVSVTGTDATCQGCANGIAAAGVSGGTAPFTYLWDDPAAQTNATATGLPAGLYNVTVTDASGCTATGSVTISEPTSNVFTLNVVTTNVICTGGCDGTATANTQNGTAPFSYQWDDPLGQTGMTASALCIGTYNITVTDDTGAVLMTTFTIYQPSEIMITPLVTGATCGNADGSVTLTVTGGTPGYLYAWSTGGNTAVESGLAAGVYSVTVTDANACTAVKSITVGNSDGPAVTAAGTDNTCSGANDGTATATVTGGTAPYTYLWDDAGAQATATATGLTVGSYSVLVTDAGGCVNTSNTVNIAEPSALSAFVSMIDANGGTCNGQGTVTGSGGTPPYQYAWNDPAAQSTMNAVGLCPGAYTATLSDANGCTASASGTVGSNVGLTDQSGESGFAVYPIPTDNMIWVEHKGVSSDWNLRIYDFTGKVILVKNEIADASLSVSLGEFPKGIYLAKLASTKGDISTYKIILE